MFQLIDPKILSFALIGAVGFVIDAAILTIMSVIFGLDVLLARAISFSCATLVTWLLNRTHTFAHQTSRVPRARKKEYFLYLTVQVVGAAINFAVFLALIEWYPVLKQMPVVPLAGGAAVALIFNFTMSRKYVFVKRGVSNE